MAARKPRPREVNVRARRLLPVLAAFMFIAAPAAQAAVPHVVQPGETLWSIAAATTLTPRTVAAFKGLWGNGRVGLGSTIQVRTTVGGYAALQNAGLVSPPAAPAAAPSTSSTTATATAAPP